MKKVIKGFTLVELVIVIAVIAILSAVLVPTFSNVVSSAKISKDKVLVRNLNVEAIENEKAGDKPQSPRESIKSIGDVEEEDFVLSSKNFELIYDSVNNRFALFDVADESFFYYDTNFAIDVTTKTARANYWRITDKIETKSNIARDFSIYLTSAYSGENTITVSTGIDVLSTKINNITYSNKSAKTVKIFTNGGTLTIDAENDTIYHYGDAEKVNIESVHTASYHENGNVNFVAIAGGNLVIEPTAKVLKVHFDATVDSNDNTKFENKDGKKISLDLSGVKSENMPVFSRDSVEIEEDGTYVAQITFEKSEEETSTQYVWLFGNGIKEQMVVTETQDTIAENGTLKEGITMGAEDGSVAEQIANPAKRNENNELVDENNQVIDLTAVDLTKSDALDEIAVVEELASQESVELGIINFAGGSGTESDPYLIATAEQWNNISYDQGVFKIIADLDFKGSAPEAKEYRNFYLIGNNHTIRNASGPIFNQDWLYDLTIEDLKLVDCESNGSLICNYGCYSVTTKELFKNLDAENCIARGGAAFLPWVYSNYNVTFIDCDLRNVTVTDEKGAQGFICGFVGNSKNTVVIDNCTFQGKISAHLGYAEFGFANGFGTIKNSSILYGTLIEHKNSSQTVNAIGGSTRTNCLFYGTIKTTLSTKANFQNFTTGTWEELVPTVIGTDFVVNENGTITYIGDKTFAKVKVYQTVTTDRLKSGEYENGGFPTTLGVVREFSNVTQNTIMENAIDYITSIYNVAPEYSDRLSNSTETLPEGLEFNENGFVFENGTLYIDASEDGVWTSYLASTYNKLPNSTTITINYQMFDANGNLTNTTTNTYTVVLVQD